jgi:ubiquinone/menaquinone biosynthesis C-methylase UbiE
MTVEFAKVVAPGEVVGIDIEASQFATGMARAHQEGVTNVQFAVGNLYALTFPDGAFDAVFVHAVLYHLHDPRAALAEVYRVLKPGGVVGVRDADHGGNVYSPSNATLAQTWELIDHVLQQHGANPFMGRTQRALLRAAGFRRVEASASYDYAGTAETTHIFSTYWREFLGQQHTEEIIAQGWADRPTLEAMCAALAAWGAHPDAFFARARCEAAGWKE